MIRTEGLDERYLKNSESVIKVVNIWVIGYQVLTQIGQLMK